MPNRNQSVGKRIWEFLSSIYRPNRGRILIHGDEVDAKGYIPVEDRNILKAKRTLTPGPITKTKCKNTTGRKSKSAIATFKKSVEIQTEKWPWPKYGYRCLQYFPLLDTIDEHGYFIPRFGQYERTSDTAPGKRKFDGESITSGI